MTFPITYTLKMDLSGTVFGGTPTWTDVTAYMLPFKQPGQISDGRQDESSDVNPGQFTFCLDNRDSRFTPGNAGSPYYPHVKAGVRVRLEITVNATTIEYFDGYVDSFDTYLDSDRAWGLCDVTATDLLGRLGKTVPLRSILAEEMLKSSPQAYVPMTETVSLWNTTQVALPLVTPASWATGTDHTTSTLSSYSFGGTGPHGDLSGALTIADYSPSDGIVYEITPAVASRPVLGATAYCAAVWFKNPVGVAGRPLVLLTTANEAMGVDVSSPGAPAVVKAFVGSTLSTGTGGAFTYGTYHFIAVQVTATGTGPYTVSVSVYIDGSLLETTSASLTSKTISQIMIGGQLISGASTTMMPGNYAHFATWTSPPSWSTLYNAGFSGFSGEGTPTHLARLLGYRSTASVVTSGTYSGTVGLHDIAGQSVQQVLFDTAHVEAAPLYADGQGRIVMLNRGQMTSPSTAVTLDGHDGDIQASLRVRSDDQYLVNDYQVTPASGNVQRVQDVTSQGAYGYYSNSLSAPFSSDSDALTVAQNVVTSLKDPQVGASQLDVDLFAVVKHNPALVASLLSVRTGQVAALTNLPAPFGGVTVMVQGRQLAFTTSSALLTVFTTGTGAGTAPSPTGAAA